MTNTKANSGSAAASELLNARAVRERCHGILAARAELENFRVHLGRLEAVADYVVETIRVNYPDLDIPFHARWRHFVFDGVDRWLELSRQLNVDSDELARIRFDLVVTSVLLDAGAGPSWRYFDKRTGKHLNRSEGLALASLDGFAAGLFSSSSPTVFHADSAALSAMTCEKLGAAFQVSDENPINGLEGRVALMRALGDTLRTQPEFFRGERPRIGYLFDWIKRSHQQAIDGATLLEVVLEVFGGIWPGRLEIDGINLGDTWHHPLAAAEDETDGLVPFHKLSQWLTYSLIEPLQDAGIDVTGIENLTGLAEYRNGGLLMDMGALEVREPKLLERPHNPGDTIIVEWRALTVALLDHLAVLVRSKLGLDAQKLPLASILEGGTWAAGRRIAAELRPNAEPPIKIVSDGSVF